MGKNSFVLFVEIRRKAYIQNYCLRLARIVHYVRRLQIPMHDSFQMQILQPFQDGFGHFDDFFGI